MDASDSARSLAKERLIDRYTQKWDDILFSTKQIDRAKAEAAIIKAYNLIDRPAPDIYFLSSPSKEQCAIFSKIADRYVNDFVLSVLYLKSDLIDKITTQIKTDFQEIYNYPIRLSESTSSIGSSRSKEKFSELCWIVYERYLYEEATGSVSLLH